MDKVFLDEYNKGVKPMQNLKAQMGPTGSVVAVIVVAVMVILGGLTYGYIRNAMTGPMSALGSTNFNNTVTQVDNNTWAGLQLMSVAAIVMAAVAIIGIVLLLKAVG